MRHLNGKTGEKLVLQLIIIFMTLFQNFLTVRLDYLNSKYSSLSHNTRLYHAGQSVQKIIRLLFYVSNINSLAFKLWVKTMDIETLLGRLCSRIYTQNRLEVKLNPFTNLSGLLKPALISVSVVLSRWDLLTPPSWYSFYWPGKNGNSPGLKSFGEKEVNTNVQRSVV